MRSSISGIYNQHFGSNCMRVQSFDKLCVWILGDPEFARFHCMDGTKWPTHQPCSCRLLSDDLYFVYTDSHMGTSQRQKGSFQGKFIATYHVIKPQTTSSLKDRSPWSKRRDFWIWIKANFFPGLLTNWFFFHSYKNANGIFSEVFLKKSEDLRHVETTVFENEMIAVVFQWCALPLVGIENQGLFTYELLVYTGLSRRAGTLSRVFFRIGGESSTSAVRELDDGKRNVSTRPLKLGSAPLIECCFGI